MNKENKNDSIQIIIYILAMVIILLLFIVAYSLRVSASPMKDTTVSVNASISTLKSYVNNKMAQDASSDNVLLDGVQFFGDQLINAFGLPGELNDYVAATGIPITGIAPSEFQDAYNNNDLQWFQANFGITYESDYSNMDEAISQMTEYIVDSVESDIVIYNCPSPSHVADMVNLELNANDVQREIFGQYSNQYGEIFPIFYYRWRSDWCSCSFQNEPSDDLCIDGLVLDSSQSSENWSNFVTNVDFYAHHGYLPEGSPVTVFNFYYNGVKVNAPFYHILNHITQFPSYLEVWGYDTIRDEGVRSQSALFGTDGDVFLFYRSEASYLKYNQMSTKSVIPYDFSVNFPNTDFSTLDFSQILKVIRDENILSIKNTQEMYKRLNDTFSQGIQDILDAQKTTNELLLALLRYYDKNIVKDNKNITDILVAIYDCVDVIRDNILFSDDDYSSLSDEVNEAMNNSQIKNKLENTFPFSVKRDFEHVLDYFDEDIIETNPRFVFNFDLFHDEVHDYVEFDVDLTQLPGISIFRSFFHAFIVVLFNFGCFKLYDKFLTWYLS